MQKVTMKSNIKNKIKKIDDKKSIDKKINVPAIVIDSKKDSADKKSKDKNELDDESKIRFSGKQNDHKKNKVVKIKDDAMDDKSFKKMTAKEKRIVNKKVFINKMFSSLKLQDDSFVYKFIGYISKWLDVGFNFVSVFAVVVGIILAIRFIIYENWLMTAISCLFILIMIVVNERIK